MNIKRIHIEKSTNDVVKTFDRYLNFEKNLIPLKEITVFFLTEL